jgi:integrase
MPFFGFPAQTIQLMASKVALPMARWHHTINYMTIKYFLIRLLNGSYRDGLFFIRTALYQIQRFMFISRMDITFWRHKSKQSGKSQLYCRITIAGERQEIGSTGITIYNDHWDGQQVSDADKESGFKNEQLDLLRNQLRATFNDLFRKKQKITAAKVKRAWQGQSETISMLSAFEMYLKDSASDPERDLEGSSLEVYDNVRKKLIDFLISEKAIDLLVEDFDLEWVKKYRRWMKKLPQKNGKIGHADSYVVKHTQTIKNMLTWAKLHKLADTNPLEGLRVKNAEYGKPVFITDEQFERLRKHRFTNKNLQETADIFIILCRCGFHYGDLEDFVDKHSTALRKGVDGELWLIKKRIKTEVAIRVPVFEEVSEIVSKYGGWEKLPIRSLTQFNEWLKIIAAMLDLPEDLSSKAGRKTFTNWCYNTLILSTDTIKVLLGRKSDKGLEVYGSPDEHRVVAELGQSLVMQGRKMNKKTS